MSEVPLLRDLPAVLMYPLRGHSLIVVLACTIVMGLGHGLNPPLPVGLILVILMVAYPMIYGFKVIRSVAEGDPDSPPWVAFRDPVGLWLRPLGALVAMGVVITGLPVVLGRLAPDSAIVQFPAILLGVIAGCVWPMALIAYAMHGTLAKSLHLRVLFSSIRRALPDYYLLILINWISGLLIGVLFLGITWAVGLLALQAEAYMVLQMLCAGFVAGYWIIFQACIAGRIYRQAEARIGWFTEEPDPPAPWMTWSLAVFLGLGLIHVGVIVSRGSFMLRTVSEEAGMPVLPWHDEGMLWYKVEDLDRSGEPIEYTVSYIFRKRGEGFLVNGMEMQDGRLTMMNQFTVNRMGMIHPEELPSREIPIRGNYEGRGTRKVSILCGPTGREEGDLYVNEAKVAGLGKWERWDVFIVEDPALPGPLYYDQVTGYLVGMDFSDGEGKIRRAKLFIAKIPGLRTY